jgi:hypothetical protein
MSYLPPPSLKHNLMPSPTLNNINDWRSQRSLYMGSNATPQYHRQVSYSPPQSSVMPHVGSVIPFSQVTPIEQVNNLSGKILYPSSSYQYPSNHNRSHGRLHPNSMPPSTPSYTNDWRAHQMSPVISSPQMPPPGEQVHHLTGEVLYPSSSYQYGNPPQMPPPGEQVHHLTGEGMALKAEPAPPLTTQHFP